MKRATLRLLPLLFGIGLAVPDVTVIPRDAESCSAYPKGPSNNLFYIKTDSTDKGIADNLFAYDKTIPYFTSPGVSHNVSTLVIEASRQIDLAKQVYQCQRNAQLAVYPRNVDINVSHDAGNAFLWEDQGYKPQLYAHEIDGVRQPDTYLGALGLTTWAFYFRPAPGDGTSPEGYYGAKLSGVPADPDFPPHAGYRPEFYGFLKVVSA
ncbi:hypothetical protein EJ05DRAFT_165324 [Pseudovirgaria hyperparasitica]|uniref:Uncharacterized protein n=1 Tax=Pseudovirgaria hyperparasitica TaxID=470096 RepID=A0A6A6VSM5_9PEZI|nr:uncharacterized protein EJ05DRAFT_165324 [Pseudovirgaria hyperparasitica]KAF2753592.1 hypothetical protein EJ05DRAFT_165324 [Pseudovirgaria hyperparasitica]